MTNSTSTFDRAVHPDPLMLPMDEHEARVHLIDVAEHMLHGLYEMNRYGDAIDKDIAVQSPDCAFGQLRDALVTLCRALWPEFGEAVLRDAEACGCDLKQSAMFFIDRQRIVHDAKVANNRAAAAGIDVDSDGIV